MDFFKTTHGKKIIGAIMIAILAAAAAFVESTSNKIDDVIFNVGEKSILEYMIENNLTKVHEVKDYANQTFRIE